MPNKTTQLLKELNELFENDIIVALTAKTDNQGFLTGTYYPDDEIGGNIREKVKTLFTEALSQQQQEDYQEVLDLELMKDEEESVANPYGGPDEYIDKPFARNRNEFRKELRMAIAEKKGKV